MTAKVIAVSTNKGGTLKTSLTCNIAGVLSKDKKILIVDADNQGNAALTFGKNPDKYQLTLYDVLVDGLDTKKAIYNIYENIDLLPSNDEMAFFEFEVLTKNTKKGFSHVFTLLRNALESVLRDYDYILIDSPPNLGLTQGNVLTAADEVLIPFQPENYSMRSLTKIIKSINDFKTLQNPNLSIMGVVATLVKSGTVLHSQTLQECRKYCQEHSLIMYDTVIPVSIRFASSVAFDRLPAVLSDKGNVLVASYFELVKEIQEKGGL